MPEVTLKYCIKSWIIYLLNQTNALSHSNEEIFDCKPVFAFCFYLIFNYYNKIFRLKQNMKLNNIRKQFWRLLVLKVLGSKMMFSCDIFSLTKKLVKGKKKTYLPYFLAQLATRINSLATLA